jgi:hypothetical protein
MPALSAHATEILERMDPDLGYELSELREFVPELSMESLREVMHELWIARHVERFRESGWQRARSMGSQPASMTTVTWGGAPPNTHHVRPEQAGQA